MAFIQESRGGPPQRSEHVAVCRDCGEFRVSAQQEGVRFVTRFTLPTWELVAAAAQYAKILDTEAGYDDPATHNAIAAKSFELATITLMRRLPKDDPARVRAANVLVRFGDPNGILRA